MEVTQQPKTVSDDTGLITQLKTVSACLDEVSLKSGMIDAGWLHLCPRHIAGILKHKIYPEINDEQKTLSMASALRWARAIRSSGSTSIAIVERDYWAVDQYLNLSARVDMCLRVSGVKYAVKTYGLSEDQFDMMLETRTVKKRHVTELSAILHLLDFDHGIIIYDTIKRYKMFQVRRTSKIVDAIVRKCRLVGESTLTGVLPPPCKDSSGQTCVNKCPFYDHTTQQETTRERTNSTTQAQT